MEMKIIICLLIGVIMILATMLFLQEYKALKKWMANIESQNNTLNVTVGELKAQITLLNKTRSSRIPYEVAQAVLNARAAINREREEVQLHDSFLENAEAWLENALTIGTKREKGE